MGNSHNNLKLEEIREKIDAIDNNIVYLLALRFKEVERLASLKNGKIEDKEREEKILLRLEKIAEKYGVENRLIFNIFKIIFKYSKKLQKRLKDER